MPRKRKFKPKTQPPKCHCGGTFVRRRSVVEFEQDPPWNRKKFRNIREADVCDRCSYVPSETINDSTVIVKN